MKLFIELRDGVTLQLPFREPSKVRHSSSDMPTPLIRMQNWQWDGKVDVKGRPRKREAATIHFSGAGMWLRTYTSVSKSAIVAYLRRYSLGKSPQ